MKILDKERRITKEYLILFGNGGEEHCEEIQKLLNEGFELVGQPFPSGRQLFYGEDKMQLPEMAQALIKRA